MLLSCVVASIFCVPADDVWIGLYLSGVDTPMYQEIMSRDAPESVEDVCWVSPHDCAASGKLDVRYPKHPGAGEADCNLTLVPSENGDIEIVSVNCDDPIFENLRLYHVGDLYFPICDECGRPCPQIGTEIEYPVLFRLED